MGQLQKKILICVGIFLVISTIAFVGLQVYQNHQNRIRWQAYLDEVIVDSWHVGDAPYDNFLDMNYLVEFLNSRPTREEIKNMDMELYDAGFRLVRWEDDEQHRLEFAFCNNAACSPPHSEAITTLLMMDVRYFDGIALYKLQDYDLDDAAGLFSVRYGVNVSANHLGNVSFTYQDIDFTIDFAFYGIVRARIE